MKRHNQIPKEIKDKINNTYDTDIITRHGVQLLTICLRKPESYSQVTGFFFFFETKFESLGQGGLGLTVYFNGLKLKVILLA